MPKLDLVQILLDHYADRIQPSIPHEVQDIAEMHGVSAEEVCQAMFEAMDELDIDAEEQSLVLSIEQARKTRRARGRH